MNRRINLPVTSNPIDKLEIGCGNKEHQRTGYIGLDVFDHGQDIVWNIEEGLPIHDNVLSEVYASHVLEHLHQDKIVDVMNEIWRVLKPGGKLVAVVPHISHHSAHIPSHLTRWDEGSVEFFTRSMNKDYDCKDDVHGLGVVRVWKLVEMVFNDKKHLHFTLTPEK